MKISQVALAQYVANTSTKVVNKVALNKDAITGKSLAGPAAIVTISEEAKGIAQAMAKQGEAV